MVTTSHSLMVVFHSLTVDTLKRRSHDQNRNTVETIVFVQQMVSGTGRTSTDGSPGEIN